MVKQFSNIRRKLIPWQQWMDRSLAWWPEADNNQQCPSRFTTTIRRLIRPTNRSLGQQPITARELSTRGSAALPDCRTASSYFLLNTTISHRVQRRHAARTTSHPFLRAGAFPVNALRERLFSDYTAVFRSCRATLRFLSGETRWFNFDVTTLTGGILPDISAITAQERNRNYEKFFSCVNGKLRIYHKKTIETATTNQRFSNE